MGTKSLGNKTAWSDGLLMVPNCLGNQVTGSDGCLMESKHCPSSSWLKAIPSDFFPSHHSPLPFILQLLLPVRILPNHTHFSNSFTTIVPYTPLILDLNTS